MRWQTLTMHLIKPLFGIIHGTSTAAIRYYEIFTMNCYLLTSEL